MPSSSRRSGRSGRSRRSARSRRNRSHGDPGTKSPGTKDPGAERGPSGAGAGSRGTGSRNNDRDETRNGAEQAQAGKPGQEKPTQRETNQTKPTRRGGGRNQQRQQRRGHRRVRTVDETSAGGLVVDTDTGRAALIGRADRRGRLLWSLPKGHIEQGETAEQAAVREVAEETGIAGVVLSSLGTIDYWFVAEDRRVHKTVHHFLMRAVGGELSDADLEVTEVAWVGLDELERRLAYADERRLVRRADELLAEAA